MIMDRVTVDINTGQLVVVPLTQAELDAQAAYLASPEYALMQAKLAAEATAISEKDIAKADAVVAYMMTHTPAECAGYVNTNVTSLATAKDLLSKFAIALCVISKRLLGQ
jgi:hypothetical protein